MRLISAVAAGETEQRERIVRGEEKISRIERPGVAFSDTFQQHRSRDNGKVREV